jgi:hypothetical protein
VIDIDLSVAARMPRELMVVLNTLSAGRRRKILREPSRHRSHTELFRDACAMSEAGISDKDQHRILEIRFDGYHRRLDPREIEDAVQNAGDAENRKSSRRYPVPNSGAWAEVVAGCDGALERLRAESPVGSPERIRSEDVLDRFFGDEALLCLGQSLSSTYTEKRAHFRGFERELPFMVPNAMSAPRGLTKDGRDSNRCLSNAGPRSRLIVEYDFGTLDEQAALHLHLRGMNLPLQMVVFSGSKSLHGWFDVTGCSDEQFEQVCRYAAYLGADTATFGMAQMVRTPNALRDGQTLQAVQYLA